MASTIRKAVENDADTIAHAILVSSRAGKSQGYFDLLFGASDDDELMGQLKKLTLSSVKSYCHFSNFLIAESGGKVAGVLCGYEPRLSTDEIFSKALEDIGADGDFKERTAAYLICRPDVDNKTWLLDFIEVQPGFNTLEIAKELIQKSLLTARLKGYRKVQAMIEIGSVETKMSYEKLGFAFVDEKRSDYYKEAFGRPGIMRLQMTL